MAKEKDDKVAEEELPYLYVADFVTVIKYDCTKYKGVIKYHINQD